MQDFSETIKQVQTALGLTADGIAGPLTWAAIAKHLENGLQPASDSDLSTLDARSASNIAGLPPVVQNLATQFVDLCAVNGLDARIISGARTYEEQDALYEQGRTTPGEIVTNARGGYSNHNFQLAFDIGLFEGGKYIDDVKSESYVNVEYAAAGKIGKQLGLIWGGDWTTFPDIAHFEYRPEWAADLSEDEALAQYRARTAEGESLLVS